MPHDAEIRSLVERVCVEIDRELRAFLLGILKDVHLAEDAYQKTVVRAIEASDSASKATVRGWIFRIALNEARELKRVSKRQGRLNQAVWESFPDSDRLQTGKTQDGPEWVAAREEQVEIVRSALQRLDGNYREVVVRRIQRGQTFAEIAADLNRPLGTVLTWMRRALLELREMEELRHLSDSE